MEKNILIITGAGASYGAADPAYVNVNSQYRPPLTNDLFSGGTHQHIPWVSDCLKENPVAAQIGLDRKGNQPLEKYLLDLKNSKSKMLKKMYWAVPIYLHELFLKISHAYIISNTLATPSNYLSLITAIARSDYNKIIWINLNYDLLADYAIEAATKKQIKDLDDYMKLETEDKIKIMYTKPHGSANWYRRNKASIHWNEIKNGRTPDDFENLISEEIYTENMAHEARLLSKETHRYPAVAAPIGEYDEYFYKEHKNLMKSELKKTSAILCIGFSALDKDVLELIKQSIPNISKLKLVNGTVNASRDAYANICRYYESNGMRMSIAQEIAVYNGEFSIFIRSGEIDRWLSQ